MKILYGLSGEGFGHSSRAKKVIPFLERQGHEVLVFTYGQAYKVLKKDFRVVKIEGGEFVFREGRLKKKRTIWRSSKSYFKNVWKWRSIRKKIERFKPEVCISDMEPIVPIIRRLYGLPLICFDNQHRLTHLELKVPKGYRRSYLAARSIVHRFVSRADAFVILSFVKGKIKGNNAYIVSPLLRDEVLKLKRKRGGKVLVYLTKKDDRLLDELRGINEEFVVYGHGKRKRDGNLVFRKIGPGFLYDLAECKAVIATAGFTLISEALYLKKPYFAIPLRGQFEQTLNALFLKKSGLGDYREKPAQKDLEKFLGKLGFYEKRLKRHKMDPDEALREIEWALAKIGKVLENVK